jgi:hypothetical protein
VPFSNFLDSPSDLNIVWPPKGSDQVISGSPSRAAMSVTSMRLQNRIKLAAAAP